jgi:hypothetical protein
MKTKFVGLVAALAMLAFLMSSVQGDTNCLTNQCVQNPYNQGSDGINQWCWLTTINADGTGTGTQYSTTTAISGYGYDSQGGQTWSRTDMYSYPCHGTHDCTSISPPPPPPITGVRSTLDGGSTAVSIEKTCHVL